MRAKFRLAAFGLIFVVIVFAISPVSADSHLDLPLDLSGEIDGAAYRIKVPENWNGTLLVYAHGYWSTPRETEISLRGIPEFEETLLAAGYALAASSFNENIGWAVKEGLFDTKMLTNFFRNEIAEPDTIILYGNSMGGVISTKSIEKFHKLYDAAIPMCTSGAGSTWVVDHWLDISLAYDVTMGWPESWGEIDHVRPDLNVFTEILPLTISQIFNPENFGRMEFIRLVNDLPQEDFYAVPNNLGFWAATALFTFGRGELEARAGGNPAQNIDQVYSLTEAEIAYLSGLGVDAEALLGDMNARTIYQADKRARVYVMKYADYKGRLHTPVLTLHTLYDTILRMETTAAYKELVEDAGKSDYLVQVYTDGVGHCNFTPDQLLAVIEAVNAWLETGNPPGDEFFPESLGFVPDYEPPPWTD